MMDISAVLYTASDPWALVLISFCIASVIVVCGAIALESKHGDADFNDHDFERSTTRKDDRFFDKITEFRNEI